MGHTLGRCGAGFSDRWADEELLVALADDSQHTWRQLGNLEGAADSRNGRARRQSCMHMQSIQAQAISTIPSKEAIATCIASAPLPHSMHTHDGKGIPRDCCSSLKQTVLAKARRVCPALYLARKSRNMTAVIHLCVCD